jgi:L-asparaginase/Glu-tRNA(Gln) amidotransferase subunit D
MPRQPRIAVISYGGTIASAARILLRMNGALRDDIAKAFAEIGPLSG